MKTLNYKYTINTISTEKIQERINEYGIQLELNIFNENENLIINSPIDIDTENLIKIDVAMLSLTYYRF